jgi:hypothetical protein
MRDSSVVLANRSSPVAATEPVASISRPLKKEFAGMTANKSTMERIARAEAAQKSGQLASYAPAKAASEANKKTPASWGPAMRV